MQKIIHFLRGNKIARLILAALVLFSFFALALHHHEAGETVHDCPVCRLVQTLSVLIVALAVFLFIEPAPSLRLRFIRTPRFVPVSVHATPLNRAPPSFL